MVGEINTTNKKMPGVEPVWEAVSWVLLGFAAFFLYLLFTGRRSSGFQNVTSLEWINFLIHFAAYAGFASTGGWQVWKLSGWAGHMTALIMLVISIVVTLGGHWVFHIPAEREELIQHPDGSQERKIMVQYPGMHWGMALIAVGFATAIVGTERAWRASTTAGVLVLIYAVLIAIGLLVYYFYPDYKTKRSKSEAPEPMETGEEREVSNRWGAYTPIASSGFPNLKIN